MHLQPYRLIQLFCVLIIVFARAADSEGTKIKGNTEITATSTNMTAIASGSGNVAKNRVGVVSGVKKGNIKITASATNVTTISTGRNRKACTNIGSVVSDECK